MGADKNAVRERPLLMSGPMVRAVLDGRKTQTRRVIVPQPEVMALDSDEPEGTVRRDYLCLYADSPNAKKRACWPVGEAPYWTHCPYGQPGDRLWVREAFYIDLVPFDRGPLPKLRPKELPTWKCSKCGLETGDSADILGPVVNGVRYLVCPVCKATGEFVDANECIYYRANGECCEQIPECCCGEIGAVPWRPSIHMPRWASRLSLEITEVRVERIRDVSEADAIAEGYPSRSAFINSDFCLNLWHANPFMWCISFKPVDVRPSLKEGSE